MNDTQTKNESAFQKIQKGRQRTNILRKYEQMSIAYLVQRIPSWITSDMLTGIGFFGSVLNLLAFVLARYYYRPLLLIGIIGFIVNWFGDSLDGRLAYYRNTPRKWYGFSLDLCADWITAILIGSGVIIYIEGDWDYFGFLFVSMYGLAMMIALLRYKIVNIYSIDSGLFGPTEVRILLALILITEVVFPGSIVYSTIGGNIVLIAVNISDFSKLLKMADARDKEELAEKNHKISIASP
ncbi:MAG: CDP-alcohol phosphatidyltransferase [Dysgonamonadaceae bacterium]|jgi:hypothetical protein|nr:CDP-alcohol phosphatidyltransferase [Dysgonamonadaceae bacterium]